MDGFVLLTIANGLGFKCAEEAVLGGDHSTSEKILAELDAAKAVKKRRSRDTCLLNRRTLAGRYHEEVESQAEEESKEENDDHYANEWPPSMLPVRKSPRSNRRHTYPGDVESVSMEPLNERLSQGLNLTRSTVALLSSIEIKEQGAYAKVGAHARNHSDNGNNMLINCAEGANRNFDDECRPCRQEAREELVRAFEMSGIPFDESTALASRIEEEISITCGLGSLSTSGAGYQQCISLCIEMLKSSEYALAQANEGDLTAVRMLVEMVLEQSGSENVEASKNPAFILSEDTWNKVVSGCDAVLETTSGLGIAF